MNLILVEKKERICTVTLSRPEKRNALSPLMLSQIAETLNKLREEGEIRCLIIRGAGEKAFSAGIDLSDIPSDPKPEPAPEGKHPLQVGIDAIIDFPFPVLAMINGYAFGAGCDLASACDIRIASESALFSMPPAKLGILYHPEGILRFINLIGLANAKEMFFTGRIYKAPQAREMGLVNYVVPADQLASFTYQMAQEISENAPLSLSSLKTVFHVCLKHQGIAPEDVRDFQEIRGRILRSEDLKEGQRAMREKRKPVFQGR